VVTTPVVLQGLAPAPEDIVRVGSDARAIAAEIVSLLRDPAEAAALGRRGRAWASGRFSWRDSLEAFERNGPARESAERAPRGARLPVARA
jgi:glycosyltransferase involved in cell wall biosynthesis